VVVREEVEVKREEVVVKRECHTASTTEIFAKLHKDSNIPYAEGTHWHSRFGHLVTYGAGYYGYLYSQVFAGDIWQHCFEGDNLRRESGERLWQNMLIHGGCQRSKRHVDRPSWTTAKGVILCQG
jgi:Zn-dependent oligopeptidase